MIIKQSSNVLRKKRHLRLRKIIIGTITRPRLNIFRSNKFIYVQLIDDNAQNTLCSVHSKETNVIGSNIKAAQAVGTLIAQKALALGIKNIVFDRSGYLYHGKIKALAEACRQSGLQF
ncbi:50S ribosomal protein L18 [Candidatus Phytoplasma australiense]|uniref:Large ribosomal subunit protein uL18 n=3 Tax=16SrXII (Stolbur group) TaxID=85632 RepID=RL18_PHYAS|nr:50S ribosomal protein L18 [Candidatus Phytoplasma australiense]B1VAD2.1 RecName: Full=Large ribosomal subunit protein uL18; AltName: Full=50S ribosomal protein L18 [Candidatus Phytoplasma australiense]AGL90292.1 50S ribosomal protein L18 [Strawberry lethal yellows phytoplasma (CPA) str. NZSb11]CAM11905.1 50S ribosomal protein L18 [Candidatus Phytoplasma australiense]